MLKHLQYPFKIKFELCDLTIIESLLINIESCTADWEIVTIN